MASKKLVCRHCQGDHLSLQCPTKKKDRKPVVLNLEKQEKTNILQPKLLAQISPLPKDITKKELADLLKEWGPIGNIFIQNDRASGLLRATVEFKKRTQGLKAIYQLDKTTFDYLIINIKELNSRNLY